MRASLTLAHREVLALAWPAGHTPRPRMGTDAIHPNRCLALTRRHDRGGSRLTRIGDGLYTRPRMGTDAIQPSRCLALTRRHERGGSRLTPISGGRDTRSPMGTDTIHPNRCRALTQRDERGERGGSRLTPISAGRDTRSPMGTDAIHPNRCLALSQPTTRLPDYPTTRLPDYRAPLSRPSRGRPPGAGADRGTIDPRGTQPPRIRASSGRPRRPPLPPVQTNMRSDACRPPPRVACAGMPFRRGARASKEVRPRGLTQRPGGRGRERVSPSLD